MKSAIIIHPAAIDRFVEKSWIFSYKTLWYQFNLRESEMEQIKAQIYFFYSLISPEEFQEKAEEYFIKFCNEISSCANNQEMGINDIGFLINQVIYKAV